MGIFDVASASWSPASPCWHWLRGCSEEENRPGMPRVPTDNGVRNRAPCVLEGQEGPQTAGEGLCPNAEFLLCAGNSSLHSPTLSKANPRWNFREEQGKTWDQHCCPLLTHSLLWWHGRGTE